MARHLLWLVQAHSLENRRRNVSENTICLLETPAFRRVGHDEGYFVGCVRGLGFAVFEFHFFGIATKQELSANSPEVRRGMERRFEGQRTRDPK